ncbi:hypothetical protein Syun_012657 [Stephania yunnanensis]|uniref:Uncharacterized protein n=1 Tax=Stephania yunnanensis TaxID=152371 RepID=A0AAP0PGK9_9MAGN
MCQPHLHAHKNPPNTPTYTYTPQQHANQTTHSFLLEKKKRLLEGNESSRF